MSRISLTDGSRKWFNVETAIAFAESTIWDGNNHISRATGSQWEHECLYYTRSGNWVLNNWSAYQGTCETYSLISVSDAIDWLILNQLTDAEALQKLPKSIQAAVNDGIALAEV